MVDRGEDEIPIFEIIIFRFKSGRRACGLIWLRGTHRNGALSFEASVAPMRASQRSAVDAIFTLLREDRGALLLRVTRWIRDGGGGAGRAAKEKLRVHGVLLEIVHEIRSHAARQP